MSVRAELPRISSFRAVTSWSRTGLQLSAGHADVATSTPSNPGAGAASERALISGFRNWARPFAIPYPLQKRSGGRPRDNVPCESQATRPRCRRRRPWRDCVSLTRVSAAGLQRCPWRQPRRRCVSSPAHPVGPGGCSIRHSNPSSRNLFVNRDHATNHRLNGRNFPEYPQVRVAARDFPEGRIHGRKLDRQGEGRPQGRTGKEMKESVQQPGRERQTQ